MVLMILISLSIVGTVSADYRADNCRQLCEGNGTPYYGYGMMGGTGARMMESVEITAMGQPMHDEMQGLVTKMMAGSLSAADQTRMVEIMNKYPGASNMMVTRVAGGNSPGWNGYPGMMGPGSGFAGAGMMGDYRGTGKAGMMGDYWGAGSGGMMNAGYLSAGAILIVVFFVIWLVAGILLIIWLVRKLMDDKKSPSSS